MSGFNRTLQDKIIGSLGQHPINAIIGTSQVGKSTLAKEIISLHPGSIYLDLERPSDRTKLSAHEDYFNLHEGILICIDAVQLSPDLFSVIRSEVEDTQTKFMGDDGQ